ncbi:hypothetical protein F5X68DRAFT_207126 [Plectosphaerella plurivora]|uniref:Uncharacterized protein n=1 Tax=Plectosphaerella plurivora TaxID=936078 RepID=A0A9P9AB11_9PEZI|nr:hypothetical protein F5X68DRAFT_207126 [Plectosphaerella plurivora]
MYQPTAQNMVRQPHVGRMNTYSPPQPERTAFLPYSESENAEMSYPPPPSYTTSPYESTESVYRSSSHQDAVPRTTLGSLNQPPAAYLADPQANAFGAVYQQNAYYTTDPRANAFGAVYQQNMYQQNTQYTANPHADAPAAWNQPPSPYSPGPVDPSLHAYSQVNNPEPRFSPRPYHPPAPAQLRTPSRQNHENAPDVQMSGTMGMNASGQGQQTPRNAARASSANRTPLRTPNGAEATGEAPQTPLRIHHVRLPATPTPLRLRTPPPPPDEVLPFDRKSFGKTDTPRLIPAEKPVLGLDGFGNKTDWPPLPAGQALDETPDRPNDTTPIEFYGVTRDGGVSFRKRYNGAGWFPIPDWAAEYRGRPLPPNTEDQGKVQTFFQALARATAQDQVAAARSRPVTQGRGFEGAGYRGEWQDRDFPAEEATKTEEEKEEKERREMENLRAWTNLEDTPSPKEK